MFSIGVQHVDRIQLKTSIHRYTKEVLYSYLIEHNNPDIKRIPPFKLSKTFTLEYSRRILCTYEKLDSSVHASVLREFDPKRGVLGHSCEFRDRVTGLAELSTGSLMVSLRDQSTWIVSPDLRTMYRIHIIMRKVNAVLSSFLNGFVCLCTTATGREIIYVEYQQNDNSLIIRYSLDLSHLHIQPNDEVVFRSHGCFFNFYIVRGFQNDILYETQGFFHIFENEMYRVEEYYLHNLPSRQKVYTFKEPSFIMQQGVLIRVEIHEDMNFLVGYSIIHEKKIIKKLFKLPLDKHTNILFPDVKHTNCFYTINGSTVDQFRLVYPRESLINLCCYSLALNTSPQQELRLKTLLPEEVVKNIHAFSPWKWIPPGSSSPLYIMDLDKTSIPFQSSFSTL